MILTRTAKLKLNIPVDKLLPTLQAYTEAFNLVAQEGFSKKEFNGVKLHHLTYAQTREFLPAQLAISARMKATEALKSIFKKKLKVKNKRGQLAKAPKCPQSKLCAIRYDQRSYTLYLDQGYVSLLTLNGREKVSIKIPTYYQQYFQDWRHTSADLNLNRKDNKLYLHIVFEKIIPDVPPSGNFIGVDRGVNNLAVTSTNQFYSGSQVKKICDRFRRKRRNLQKKGTKSAKRHLKRLSQQERRFKADINHQVSKKIIADLQPGDTIVLENLGGIRNKRARKPQRHMLANWSFYQLEQFIIYKAMAKGINVVYVDPRYTSQHCLACGNTQRNNRNGSYFCCKKCNFKMNADLVGAKNIVLKYLGALLSRRDRDSACGLSISKSQPRRAEVNQPNGLLLQQSNVTTAMLVTS